MMLPLLSDPDTNSIEILPRRNELRPLNTIGLDPDSFRTNCYEIQVTEKSLFLYQYHIVTDPPIPADSTKVWYKLVKNIELKLQKWIGLISHRSNTLWGNKYLKGETLDLVWISKYKVKCGQESDLMETQSLASSSATFTNSAVTEKSMFSLNQSSNPFEKTETEVGDKSKDEKAKYKEAETKYRVSIKLTNKLDLKTLMTDEKEKGKIIQIINIKIKDKLESLGYLELGKGRFYEKSKFQQDYIEEVGLQVLRGFKFSLMSLSNNRLCLQIDPCTRILQSTNLLEVIQNMGKQAAIKLKGAVVISRYGNYKTYKIDSIEYKKNPSSYFYIHEVRKGKKPGEVAPKVKKTYAQYFKEAYGITVNNMKQPLVKIYEKPVKMIKNEKIREKPTYVFLIPELLSMTGMTIKQRNDKNAMKSLAPYTKLTPKARFLESQKLIHQIQSSDRVNQNQENKEDFSMIKIKEPTVVRGFQLNPVYVTLKDTERVEGGEFNIRQPLLKPAKFIDWMLFCSNGTKPERLKQFVNFLEKASKDLAVTLEQPFISVVNYSEGDRDFVSKQNLWLASLDKELKKGKPPQIILLYFQSYEENFYSEIKRQVINTYGVHSQVVKASTFEKQSGGLSVATGIIVQMNQKIGETVWKVERNHPQFSEKNEKKFQVFCATKKPKVQDTVNQSMMSKASSKKSQFSGKKDKKEKKDKKDKKEKKVQKNKQDKKDRADNSETEIKPEQPSNESLALSSFSKHGGTKVVDLSDSASYPSNIAPFGTDVSSIQVHGQSLSVSNDSIVKALGTSLVEEKKTEQMSEIDENSEMTQKKFKQKKQKKEKAEKKQRKDKKGKKDKKKHADEGAESKTEVKPDQQKSIQTNSQLVSIEEGKSEPKVELSKSHASRRSSFSDRSGRERKEKKQRKQKKQHKENNKEHKKKKQHKKQKHVKEEKEPVEVETKPKVCYEDILIKKEEKKMAQAKKKVIDESLKLQLNSDLQIACAGFSSSTSSANGKFTMSFVGTTNKDQSEIYTHCRYGMRRKDYLPDLEFELIFNYWLKTYYDKSVKIVDGAEKHFMPSVLVIYREGLSEDQLKKQIFREVRILKKVIREKVPKSLRYDPEIIYITVNKRVSTRFFDNSTKDARNANEGSVIFDEFARNNTMDFHLISQHVENADGTATPTQYRIVYRNRFELSEAALAQFTYEQCHNYYNWTGSVRIPAVLQCAGKLSRLVGEKVRENVFKIGGKKKREDKKEQEFKFLDQSSVSSIGQKTVNLINNTTINMSMSSSFNLFANSQLSLTNSLAQSSAASNFSASNVSTPNVTASNVSESIQSSTGEKDSFKKNKREDGKREDGKRDDKKNEFGKREFEKKEFGKKDFGNKGGKKDFPRREDKIELTVEKKEREEKPDRAREIIDTFFFL